MKRAATFLSRPVVSLRLFDSEKTIVFSFSSVSITLRRERDKRIWKIPDKYHNCYFSNNYNQRGLLLLRLRLIRRDKIYDWYSRFLLKFS